ncbi:family 20 glycosylhydrolase [Saccharicrinis aurantiacus]|uniref:family 20 glycosylhydrolase n=1 Tax=Saccharicrinis aurantiacus TaxID=1849719 RepID=UPI002493BFCF|nr:family 20 glycosylhydrolase [Saccharicrinis aurantiacus]
MTYFRFSVWMPLIVALIFMSSCLQSHKVQADELALVPLPNHIKITNGSFQHQSIKLIIEDNTLSEASQKHYIAGIERYFTLNDNANAQLVLQFKSKLQPEAYELDINKNNIVIAASTNEGFIYGLVSLFQLADQYSSQNAGLPCLLIKDAPQYSWRGMHLDVCRHFFDVDFIKKMLNGMALNKLNTFHWHLTDDQGWRIEIKKYPELTEKGAWREETVIGHMAEHPLRFDGEKHGGFYTQEQIKEVIAYASALGITVVPEIEMPGHAVAAARAFPELTCTGKPLPFNEWGVSDDVFCAGNEKTFHFLQDVLDEVIELFPSEYIHVGGDECPKTKWEQCKKCQARMQAEGLNDEMELQSYFIKRMEKYISSKGKKLIGWDEILEGGLAEGATVMSWQGVSGGIEAATHGHDVIISPNDDVYLNFYQSPYNEPTAIAGLITMESLYHWSPMPEGLDAKYQHHVLGAQGNVWTEYMKTEADVEYMVYPRLVAIAEILWTEDSLQNFQDFTRRMNYQYKRLDNLGMRYRVPYPEGALPVEALSTENNTLKLTVPISDASIYYTLDGTCPKENGLLYQDAIVFTDQLTTLKCISKTKNGRWSAVHTSKVYVNDLLIKSSIDAKDGARYKIKAGEFTTANVSFSAADKSGLMQGIGIADAAPDKFFAQEVSGFIKVPVSGIYTFKLTSADGSILSIHDREIINNDGFTYARSREGRIQLEKGLHPFVIKYFQAKYDKVLTLSAIAPDGTVVDFSTSNVYH